MLLRRLLVTMFLVLGLAVPAYTANEILLKKGTPIIFGDDANLNPADDANNLTDDVGTDTVDCDMDHTGLANAAAHQSIKCDLDTGGTANKWATTFQVMAVVDYTGETTMVDGQTVDYYWCPSPNATQANGNVAGNSGANAAVCDGCVVAVTDAEFVKMCMFIGALIITNNASVQTGYVGSFTPPMQHGQLVVFNNGGDSFEGDNVEAHVAFYPMIVEVQ